jgi:hypothetical protein
MLHITITNNSNFHPYFTNYIQICPSVNTPFINMVQRCHFCMNVHHTMHMSMNTTPETAGRTEERLMKTVSGTVCSLPFWYPYFNIINSITLFALRCIISSSLILNLFELTQIRPKALSENPRSQNKDKCKTETWIGMWMWHFNYVIKRASTYTDSLNAACRMSSL